ncbi:hypothetical protein FRC19_010880 [Serendipita sp. 401]|nr:hypothetical protein FRC15_006946 [Serendipita sp. 397]KAG8818086.1 hypothetical protein FRC19_010880 [Serendipita sp. 401]
MGASAHIAHSWVSQPLVPPQFLTCDSEWLRGLRVDGSANVIQMFPDDQSIDPPTNNPQTSSPAPAPVPSPEPAPTSSPAPAPTPTPTSTSHRPTSTSTSASPATSIQESNSNPDHGLTKTQTIATVLGTVFGGICALAVIIGWIKALS